MPKPVDLAKQALRELLTQIRLITLARATLSSVLTLLLLLLIGQILTLRWYWPALLTIPIALFIFAREFRTANLYLVENTLGEYKHILTTVNDTTSRDNEIVNALRTDMIAKLKDLKNSYFIQFGRLGAKVVGIILLSIAVVTLSAFNVHLLDVSEAANNLQNGKFFGTYDINQSALDYELNESQDIYGNKSLAQLGLEELKLEINPSDNDIDISQIEDAEMREFRESRPAQEIIATGDSSYSDDVPKEYRKIVKFYFNEITKGD